MNSLPLPAPTRATRGLRLGLSVYSARGRVVNGAWGGVSCASWIRVHEIVQSRQGGIPRVTVWG